MMKIPLKSCISKTPLKQLFLTKMRLWTQHLQDSKIQSIARSRFYPALQSVRQTTNTYYPTCPENFQQVLKHDKTLHWPLYDVPLAEVQITGPFNFTQQRIGLKGPKQLAMSEMHHINNIYWQHLEPHGSAININTNNIYTIPANLSDSNVSEVINPI
jgi:hypothetical protein